MSGRRVVKLRLWGLPEDVASAAVAVRERFVVLHESEDSKDQRDLGPNVRRYFKVEAPEGALRAVADMATGEVHTSAIGFRAVENTKGQRAR